MACGRESSSWTLHHPENWNCTCVEEWITFVADQYKFPDMIRRKSVEHLRNYTGSQLLSMEMQDFRHQLKDVGEIIYTAFKQILDVAPDYENRTKLYEDKIQKLVERCSNKDTNPLWLTLSVRDWTIVEVTSWVSNLAEEHRLSNKEQERVKEIFEGINGVELLSMSKEDFLVPDERFGELLFRSLKLILEYENRAVQRRSSELTTISENLTDQ